MNLIPYKYFVYLSYALAILNIILPIILGKVQISLILVGILSLALTIFSKGKNFPKLEYLTPKLVVLGLFVLDIFQTFTPYLFSYTTETSLVWIALVIPAISLVGIFFTKFEEENS